MSQHFLLSPAAKSLKLASVLRMSDDEARAVFRKIRWADTDGEPVCPKCGCVEAYEITTRKIFKCKGCLSQFSLTAGTIFASRKMEVRNILAAIAIFVNGIHHHIAGPYLNAYASEMAWREDFRRTSNGAQFAMVADATMAAPVSKSWCGYWQRKGRE